MATVLPDATGVLACDMPIAQHRRAYWTNQET
eukprot:COSAG06_NODE_29879_length_549_cov_0.617778_1_plen_31_part_10